MPTWGANVFAHERASATTGLDEAWYFYGRRRTLAIVVDLGEDLPVRCEVAKR